MSERALRMVLFLVVGLLLLYGVQRLTMRPKAGAGSSDLAAILGSLDGKGVDSFRITGRFDTFRLVRRNGEWRVNQFLADTNAVSYFWSQVVKAKPIEVAATSPSNHRRLGVAADSTVTFTAFRTPADTVTLLVGASGPLAPSAYVRIPHHNEVYLVQGDLQEAVQRPMLYWRNRTALQLDTAAVAAIVVTRAEGDYRLDRVGKVWQIGTAPADTSMVGPLLGALSNQQAVGFSRDSTGYGPDRRRVVVLTAKGDTLAAMAMRIGQRGEPLLTIRGSPFIFELDIRSANRLAPTKAEVTARACRGPSDQLIQPRASRDPASIRRLYRDADRAAPARR